MRKYLLYKNAQYTVKIEALQKQMINELFMFGIEYKTTIAFAFLELEINWVLYKKECVENLLLLFK